MGKKKIRRELLRTALCDIVDEFDFKKISEYYERKLWKLDESLPTAVEIKKKMISLIDSLITHKSKSIGSGGITISTGAELIITISSRGGHGEIVFGQIHYELSNIMSVQKYFDSFYE